MRSWSPLTSLECTMSPLGKMLQFGSILGNFFTYLWRISIGNDSVLAKCWSDTRICRRLLAAPIWNKRGQITYLRFFFLQAKRDRQIFCICKEEGLQNIPRKATPVPTMTKKNQLCLRVLKIRFWNRILIVKIFLKSSVYLPHKTLLTSAGTLKVCVS